MHIRAQNAALIVRRLSSDDFVQFEVFEVSPSERCHNDDQREAAVLLPRACNSDPRGYI